MPSLLSWLDFAESDRQRAMQVIDLFREKNTVDELGFSPIRDAFADHFFPGTSTIQTRARYFLFVPWILKHYEKRKLTAQELQWPWFSVGNVFGSRPAMVQWYEYTGMLGGTLWVLLANSCHRSDHRLVGFERAPTSRNRDHRTVHRLGALVRIGLVLRGLWCRPRLCCRSSRCAAQYRSLHREVRRTRSVGPVGTDARAGGIADH